MNGETPTVATRREIAPRRYVLEVTGDLDVFTAPLLKEQLLAAVEAGAKTIVVDLSAVTFLDSTTLGILVSALRRLRPVGGRLLIAGADTSVRSLFELTGLDRVFTLYPTCDEALAAVGD